MGDAIFTLTGHTHTARLTVLIREQTNASSEIAESLADSVIEHHAYSRYPVLLCYSSKAKGAHETYLPSRRGYSPTIMQSTDDMHRQHTKPRY